MIIRNIVIYFTHCEYRHSNSIALLYFKTVKMDLGTESKLWESKSHLQLFLFIHVINLENISTLRELADLNFIYS